MGVLKMRTILLALVVAVPTLFGTQELHSADEQCGKAVRIMSDLFAFDLDGTLVHPTETGGRGVSEGLQAVLGEIAKGAHTMVATGRRYRAAIKTLASLPASSFTVVNNGLVVKDGSGKTVQSHPIDNDRAIHLANLFQESGLEPYFAVDGFHEGIDLIFISTSLKRSSVLREVAERAASVSRILPTIEILRDFREAVLS